MEKTINIRKDFSSVPAGRYIEEGPDSGEEFREKLLKPFFTSSEYSEYKPTLTIILDDGVEGYGSSFLNEAFGGLVRKGYVKAEDVLKSLKFEYKDNDFMFYENRIKEYIKESEFNSDSKR